MTSRGLAWRTVAAKPVRAMLATAGIAIIGALLFDMLMLSRGLLVSLREMLDTAGYDVRVTAVEGLPTGRTPILDATALVGAIGALPEVQEVTLVRRSRVFASPPTRFQLGVTLLNVSGNAARRAWTMRAGETLPASGDHAGVQPVVISEPLADALGVGPGATMSLRGALAGVPSALPPISFRVVGVAQFEVEPGDDMIASTTLEGFKQTEPSDDDRDAAELVLVKSRPDAGAERTVAALRRLRPDLRTYSNEQLVGQFNENGFTYFRQISFVLSSITLAFAFLLVATLLSVSVNQRLHEMAALRALGLPRRRIASTLIWESVWLAGAGGLLSLPLGGLLALELDRILRRMPGLPDRLHFFVFEPRSVVLHVALMSLTALGAAIYPMWVATRLPIAATLRRETLS